MIRNTSTVISNNWLQEPRNIIYYSTTSYSRVASMQESKKQAWLSSGVDLDMR